MPGRGLTAGVGAPVPLRSTLNNPLPSLVLCLQLSCDPTSAPSRCPRVELWSWDAGRVVAGFGLHGTWATTWGEAGGVTGQCHGGNAQGQ